MPTTDLYEPKYWSLLDVLRQRYQIPVYQRPYSWGKQEVGTLIDDLVSAYADYKAAGTQENQGLFTGTIYLRHVSSAANGTCQLYDVVDGQQRLSTFSMILMALYSLSLRQGASETIPSLVNLKAGLWKIVHDEYQKDERLLTLGNVDRTIFTYLFDEGFGSIENVRGCLNNYNTSNSIEEEIVAIYNFIDDELGKRFAATSEEKHPAVSFINFLLNCVQFIAIVANTTLHQVFQMFESINSKGKPLDLIDLIKTYIFSEIPEEHYAKYLTRWGILITKTNDNLEDYFRVYIESTFKFYGQRMSMSNVRSLAKNELRTTYQVTTVGEAFEKLIDDMVAVADYYQYLLPIHQSKAISTINKNQFKLYYSISQSLGYSFSKPLFFRMFVDFASNQLSANDIAEITKAATLFQFKFLSLSRGASNRTVDTWKVIMGDIYQDGGVNPQKIKTHFRESLNDLGVTESMLSSNVATLNYRNNYKICYVFLSLVESVLIKNNEETGVQEQKFNASQAIVLLEAMGKDHFEIDHMLRQDPAPTDSQFKYYKDSDGRLVLKDGHDFPSTVVSGMDYGDFQDRTINLLGNLQIINKVGNILMSNSPLELPAHKDFTTYSQITERVGQLIKLFLSEPAFQ